MGADMIQKFWDKGRRKVIAIYALSFLLPSIMMILILDSIGISYNGKLTLLTYDMKVQCMPFITSLRYIVSDPRKLLFSWNNSLGSSYMGIFAYYMASPLNLITLLWDIQDMPKAIYILFVLKIGLSGLTFNVWLHNKYEDMEIRFWSILFSSGYALMSYVILYGICIMWLDAIILLPLVLLGVDRIWGGKRGALFLISYALVLFTNFYMAYMVGIFAFLYLCMKLMADYGRERSKVCLGCVSRFCANTVLAFGLTMPLLLPVLISAKYSSMGRNTSDILVVNAQIGIGDLLKQFVPCQYTAGSLYNANGRPYFFCGSIFLILFLVFFIQKRSWRQKAAVLIPTIMIFAGFLLPQVDYVWHGLRYPTGFSYRYAFLFSCLMIMTGYEAWMRLKIKVSDLIMGFLALYTLGEIYINDTVMMAGINKDYGYTEFQEYEAFHLMYDPFIQEIKKDPEFYRKKESGIYAYNADIIYGVNSTELFSSFYHNRIKIFLNAMGSEKDYGYRIALQGCMPLLDSLMGVKYLIENKDPLGCYIEKKSYGQMRLYENPDAISLGLLVPQTDWREDPEFTEDVFWNQRLLLQYLGIANDQIYQQIGYEYSAEIAEDGTATISIYFTQPSENATCFYLDGETWVSGSEMNIVYVDGQYYTMTNQMDTRRIFIVPDLSVGEEHEITIVGKYASISGFYLCEFNRDAYKKEIDELRKNQMDVISCEGNHIFGKIESEEGGILLATLPYDEGYTDIVNIG